MAYATFEQLESHVFKKAKKRRVAVVEAADAHVLEAVRHAVEVGLVEPVLFGRRAEVEAGLAAMDQDVTAWEIVNSPEPAVSALQAGIAVKEGRADFILKGLIPTGTLLKDSTALVGHAQKVIEGYGPAFVLDALLTGPCTMPVQDDNARPVGDVADGDNDEPILPDIPMVDSALPHPAIPSLGLW